MKLYRKETWCHIKKRKINERKMRRNYTMKINIDATYL